MEQSEQSPFELPEWAKSVNIYEVNIRQYTDEGTFNAFRKHLPRLKEMGVDMLWFMPVYPISDTKKKGTLGSYYAVSDFRNTNRKFGTPEEFKLIIQDAHKLGMKIILDWVPNHTGWDHVWIKDHPDYYTKDSSGNIIDPLNEHGASMGWTDVADLNYDNPEMRKEMVQDMMYWVREYDVDGFRHDMALLVPLDFWKETVPVLRAEKPELFLLAESEVHDHLNQDCFHSIYGWTLHHTLNDIAKGKKNAGAIDEWMTNEKPKTKKGSFLLFTSNHDENSWSGSEIERMGEAHKAFAVLVNTIDGFPLTYSGQEEPMPKRLEFFEKDTIGFKDYAYDDFYKKMNNLRHENAALWHGSYGGESVRILKDTNIYAFTRQKKGQKVTVIINLSKHQQIKKSDMVIEGKDLFSDVMHKYAPGDEISLGPWEYLVLI
ncbi:MAG: alpha-amylase [Saprospiraceae bacterium]|nr:alpha-amylase [Saprospiraceae bacterium]